MKASEVPLWEGEPAAEVAAMPTAVPRGAGAHCPASPGHTQSVSGLYMVAGIPCPGLAIDRRGDQVNI